MKQLSIILLLLSGCATTQQNDTYRCYEVLGPAYVGDFINRKEAEKWVFNRSIDDHDAMFKWTTKSYECHKYEIKEEK